MGTVTAVMWLRERGWFKEVSFQPLQEISSHWHKKWWECNILWSWRGFQFFRLCILHVFIYIISVSTGSRLALAPHKARFTQHYFPSRQHAVPFTLRDSLTAVGSIGCSHFVTRRRQERLQYAIFSVRRRDWLCCQSSSTEMQKDQIIVRNIRMLNYRSI